MITYEQYLAKSAVQKGVIDVFLSKDDASYAQFDPELGYTVGNALIPDGMDGSLSITTSQANGARSSMMYRKLPSRINTYGDSFTQCSQTNDGETWQEYLAAHLGEPIRNFGVGGFGVYQAYRRLLRTEQTEDGAEYLILYVWGDDHFRSIMRCRHAVIYPFWDHEGGFRFHNNFWCNIEMDLDSGCLVERENLLSSSESLYKMTDPAFMVESLRDDLMIQLCVIDNVALASIDITRLNALAEILGVASIDESDRSTVSASGKALKHAYGFAVTKHILDQATTFCQKSDKKLLVCLLCPTTTRQLLDNRPRYDQNIVDYLQEKRLLYFDMNVVHQRDYASFRLPIEDYLKRYFIGHYNPTGNHFFAYSIKNTIVDWLTPEPQTYRKGTQKAFDYSGYLPE